MSIEQKFNDRISKVSDEIRELEVKLEAKRSYQLALRDSLRLVLRESADVDKGNRGLREGSMPAKVREAILKAGRPLGIADLLRSVGKQVAPKERRVVGTSLNAYIRNGKTFTRPAPGTYGLIEMNDKSKAAGVIEEINKLNED